MRIIRDYCIGWVLAFAFLSIVRGVGTTENGFVQMEFWPTIVFALVFGPLFGIVSGCAQILMEERIYKRISIQKLLLLRVIYACLFLVAIILTAFVFVG